MKKSFLSYLLVLAGATQARAQVGSVVTTLCYPNPCYTPGGGSPRLSAPGNEGISEAEMKLIKARRYGQSQELRAWASGYNQELAQQMATASGDLKARLEGLRQEIERSLLAAGTAVPVSYVPTPLPSGAVAASTQARLDKIFETFKNRDPIQTANEVARFQKSLPAFSADYRDYYARELRRNFIDHRGLLRNLPKEARLPQGALLSEQASADGIRIRQGLNLVAASNFVVAAQAAAEAQPSDALKSQLALYESLSQDLTTGLLLADRMAASDPATARALLEKLLPAAQFVAGVAEGIGHGAVDLVKGLAQIAGWAYEGAVTSLTQPPSETLSQISQAIESAVRSNWMPRLYETVKGIAQDSYQTILHGSAEERGQLVGRAAFEIATAVYGGELISGAAKGGVLMQRAAAATLEGFAAEAGFAELVRAGTLAESALPALGRLSSEAPTVAAGLLRGEASVPTLERAAALSVDELGQLRRFEALDAEVATRAAFESPKDAARMGDELRNHVTWTEADPKAINDAFRDELLQRGDITSPSQFQPAADVDRRALYTSFSKPQKFYRYVMTDQAKPSSFLTRIAPDSLPPTQLKDALALKELPHYYVEVEIPTGTKLSVSWSSKNAFGDGGSLQWRIEGGYQDGWFTPPRPLP